MAKTHFSGPVASAAGFEGNVTGNLTGDVTGKLPETTIQYAETSHTAAQTRALRATPRELVPAPGAGKYIEFLSAQLFLDYSGAAMSEDSDNLAVKFDSGSGEAVSETIETTGFIDQTADTVTNAVNKKDTIVAASASVNKKLVLHNTGSGEFGSAGTPTSVLRVKVAYRVHTTDF